MAIQKTNIKDITDKNYAEFDLGLLCEDKYKGLKHIDMVVYTLLHNQHGLSVKTTMNGSKRFVDSNGNIFISITQEKLCKLFRTTKPTLIASLDRLEKNELIEIVRVGNQKCNKIYVGKLERTITLGDYMKILNLGDEVEDKEISINTINIKDIEHIKKAPTYSEVEANEELENKSSDSTNKNSNKNSIPQNNNSNNKSNKEFKPNYSLNPKIHKNLSTKFLNYGNDEDLEKMLLESQKNKFNEN